MHFPSFLFHFSHPVNSKPSGWKPVSKFPMHFDWEHKGEFL